MNFALFSENATGVELSLFDDRGGEQRIRMPERTDQVWHAYLPGVAPGQRYGYRVAGPWAPEHGHRFNPAKLLLDPYARRIDGPVPADEQCSPLAAFWPHSLRNPFSVSPEIGIIGCFESSSARTVPVEPPCT